MSLFYVKEHQSIKNYKRAGIYPNLKLRQEYSTTSMMVLAASLSLRPGLNLALCNTLVT